jgi:hypothetical protein
VGAVAVCEGVWFDYRIADDDSRSEIEHRRSDWQSVAHKITVFVVISHETTAVGMAAAG